MKNIEDEIPAHGGFTDIRQKYLQDFDNDADSDCQE